MSDYGDNISRISDLIKQSQDAPIESLDDVESTLFSRASAQAAGKAKEYTDKWDTIKEKGDEELAGVLGVEVISKGYKKVKGLYKKFQSGKKALDDLKKKGDGEEDDKDPDGLDEEDEKFEGFEEEETSATGDISSGGGGASAGADVEREVGGEVDDWVGNMRARLQGIRELPSSSSATLTNPVTDEPLLAAGGEAGGEAGLSGGIESSVSEFASRVGKIGSDALDTLKSGLGKVGDFAQAAKQKLFGKASAKATEEAVGKKVGEDEAVGLFDSVAGGIPILGEVALGITGLVSIGKAFAHLFKHKKKFAPKISSAQGISIPTAPTQLTQKYSMGLPSIDSASEVSASFSAF
tara:strand:+ start:2814 stop:3869 length:1056 start_codon:yes stop_codon:yes gene_type:complete